MRDNMNSLHHWREEIVLRMGALRLAMLVSTLQTIANDIEDDFHRYVVNDFIAESLKQIRSVSPALYDMLCGFREWQGEEAETEEVK